MALAVAGGCVVGPDFKPPPPPSVTQYTAPDEVSPGTDSATQTPQSLMLGTELTADWWSLFESAELDQLVKQAIAGSPTLEGARARLTQAQEAVTAASAALYPQVNFNAGFTREKLSAAAFGLSPQAFPLPPNFNVFQIGPSATYTLDAFGGTRRSIERQHALAEFQQDQLRATYLNLTGNTVAAAIQVAAVRAQLKAIGDTLEIDRQNLDLVKKEQQAGTVADSDVIIAASQLAADETLQPGLEQQLSAAQHALSVLLGRAPADSPLSNIDLTALTLPAQLPVSLPSALVHHRPDIQAAEAQLHAASAEIGIATAELYPNITLSAGLTAASLNGGSLFSTAGLTWSIAAGLTQPIFDGGLRRAQRRAALAAFKASAADYQQTVLQSFGQIADILQALAHDSTLLTTEKRALDLASQSVSLQRINYSKGGGGLLELLDAQRLYQQAQLGYVRAQAQRYLDTAQLLVAMGGGVTEQPPFGP
jgi:NodT family efflux transporter outer membrane factor (OMF) lipoprotein